MVKELKLDLGIGKAPLQDGWVGVDIKKWGPNVTKLTDLRKRWPWKDGSVDEIASRHLINYLTPSERKHFVNEIYRVLKPGAKAMLITPHWCAAVAYGDLSVEWPPVTEKWYFTLRADFRKEHIPWESGYKCDFDFTLGYGMHQGIINRNTEYQENALTFWKEAAQDLVVTLTKKE